MACSACNVRSCQRSIPYILLSIDKDALWPDLETLMAIGV